MSYLGLSRRIAGYLSTRTATRVSEDVLAYGVEVVLLNTANVLVTVFLGLWAKALPETLVVMATVAAVRTFAGGAHSASRVRCTMVTGSVFPLLAIASIAVSGLNPVLPMGLLTAAFILGIVAMVTFAPVDCPAAPIISQARRKRLKNGSVFMVTLLTGLALVLANRTLGVAISLGILWSAFVLTPAGHKLFQFIDSLGIWWRGGEKK